jgi:hypothetical protein
MALSSGDFQFAARLGVLGMARPIAFRIAVYHFPHGSAKNRSKPLVETRL